MLPLAVALGNIQEQAPRLQRAPVATAGCRAFTTELLSVAWPGKFKPDLPPRYDGTADPTEFLQLYTTCVEATRGDDRVLANWFAMALKKSVRSCLLNLPEESISSWAQIA